MHNLAELLSFVTLRLSFLSNYIENITDAQLIAPVIY